MLLWLESVAEMQAMQFTYSVVTACEVAYFSYIYSVVDLQFYLKATSFCRSAQLIGYTVGSVTGQILLSLELMSYYYILVFTLVLISISSIAVLLLPMPSTSMFFHQSIRREEDVNQEEDCGEKDKTVEAECTSGSVDVEMMENKQKNSLTQREVQEEPGADVEKSGEVIG